MGPLRGLQPLCAELGTPQVGWPSSLSVFLAGEFAVALWRPAAGFLGVTLALQEAAHESLCSQSENALSSRSTNRLSAPLSHSRAARLPSSGARLEH